MAATAEARRLTESHRLAQARLGARTVTRLLAVWPLLDPFDLDATAGPLAATAEVVVADAHAASVALSATYLAAFRTFELGDEALATPPVPDVLSPAAVATSLQVAGPVAIKTGVTAGRPLVDSVAVARRQFCRAGKRHALNGGRLTIINTLEADPQALGWARVISGRTCAFCAMLASRGPVYLSQRSATRRRDGRRFHDGCVVGGTLVSGPSVEASYRRWYEGELVIINTAAGDELAITPNHPVLTDQGWVPAGLLREGDQVVRRSGADLASLQVPHEHEDPSPIEDVWGSASVDGLRSVPVAPEDFHGDGYATEGQVDVVAPYGLLPDVFNSSLSEELAQHLGSWAGAPSVSNPLTASGDPLPELLGLWATPDCVMCGGDLPASLLRGEGGALQGLALLNPPAFHSGFTQPALHGGPADSIGGRESVLALPSEVPVHELLVGGIDSTTSRPLGPWPRFDPPPPEGESNGLRVEAHLGRRLTERLAGGVELSSVVDLRRVGRWSGHVFNLRTSEGWYDANTLVVSNCDCTTEPVYRRDAAWPAGTEDLRATWDQVTAGLSGREAVNAFRRHHERPDLHPISARRPA